MGYNKEIEEDLVSEVVGLRWGEGTREGDEQCHGGDADLQKSDLTKCLKAWAGIKMPASFGLAGSK